MFILPKTKTPILQAIEEDKESRRKIIRGIGDFGKGVLQSVARSMLTVGAEIAERTTMPAITGRAPRPFGQAEYTPRTEIEGKIFGTKEPISMQTVGEEVLAIGGEDFKKKWGHTAIPLGFLIAGLDVTPIGFGKRSVVKKAADKIAKTQSVGTIKSTLKPLFKEASDDVLTGLSRGLSNVNDSQSVSRIIQQVGSVNPIKPGVKKQLVKPEADSSLHQLADFMENITIRESSPIRNVQSEIKRIQGLRLSGKLKPKEADRLTSGLRDELFDVAKRQGVALRITKEGKIQLSQRASGNFVSTDFAKYPHFKDVRAGSFGGTKDITRIIQEADGSLSSAQRVKLPGQAGMLEQDVLWRTRDIIKLRSSWFSGQQQKLTDITKGITKTDAIEANKILTKISSADAMLPTNVVAARPDISSVTKDQKVIKFAQNARKYFDDVLDSQNYFRGLRDQKTIARREFYSPEQIQKASLWSEALGVGKDVNIVLKPQLPDYIRPDKPFVSHELARKANMPEYLKEMDLKTLLEKYTNTAGKDIFNTSIIQNNKAHIQQLDSMGLANTARAIQDWTSEAFAGIRASVDRAAALNPTLQSGMKHWRHALVRGVFPLNFAWNSFVQTSSANLTTMRYGATNAIAGAVDWITNPKSRKWVEENAYSYIIKTGKAGKITQQDINRGMSNAVKINSGKLEKATDAANFFTEAIERNLTGWSVLTAKRDGARRGLTGRALAEWASDGGAKTQSMYNLEDLPGILRSETVKTAAPFQTFSFEMFNTMREFAGKTGVPPATFQERMAWTLRFFAGVAALNHIGQTAIGRKPWETSSFLPFYSMLAAPIEARLTGDWSQMASTRHLPSPVGIGASFADGIRTYIQKGDPSKLRRASTRYLPGLVGIPGGTQINRLVDGLIAISDGGVEDSAGRMLFPIHEPKDQIISLLAGPWATEGGKEYWKDRKTSVWDLIKKEEEEKTQKSIPIRTPGQITRFER